MSALVGRGPERARLDALVAEGGALALVGEPGIGKTALVEYARGRAGRVLSAVGAEAELDLPFAGLLALLRPVLDRVDRLPPVQRRALVGALALGPPVLADRLVVHAATLGLLLAAAEEAPLLAVVDDAHWLDDASAAALLFAARRLEGERVALLLALRPVEGRRLDLAGVERLPVEGLALADAARLLPGVPTDVVARLHRATGGNPLALLEAPTQVPEAQLAGRDPLGEPLAVGAAVQAAFRLRLERLPPRTRTALLVFAAAGTEPLEQIAAAGAELGVTLADLAPAEADHLVERTAGGVSFRHPLVAAAAYHGARAPDRRAVHRALAAHTEGARRAGHLWGAATGPDAAAAAALEQAADDARARASFSAAALAMERAARLTAPGDARAARLLGAARDRLMGGDAARAAELAQAARAEARATALLAGIDALLGSLGMLAGSLDDGIRTLRRAAAAIAEESPDRAASMLSTAAVACVMAGRVTAAHELSRRAYEIGRRADERTAWMMGALLALASVMAGEAIGDDERALLDRWPEMLDERVLDPGAVHLIGQLQVRAWLEDYDEAEAFAARVEELVAATGAVGVLPLLRVGQLDSDLRRGRWTHARARASEALRLSEETGQVVQRGGPLVMLARLEAAMGLEQECRDAVRAARDLARMAGIKSLNVSCEAALGLLELGLGRVDRAVEHLDETDRLCHEYGLADPSVIQHRPDRIEALIRAGDPDRARAALAEFEAMAERTQRSWPLACAARCHGMLADDFDPWFERAYAHHGDAASPFELGRTELSHGERLRRARDVREARVRLRSALERFEALDAAPWAARARSELRAAGEAVAPRSTPAARALTPQEFEVALAVAGGATNREVAAALFVSPKTVEVHLSRIFKKLDVRSRTALAAQLNE